MLTFLRIERPTSATLRSSAAAASTTCWTRWMFDAKQVTTMRPWQCANTRSRLRADDATRWSRSPGGRRSSSRRTAAAAPSRPSSASRATSAGRAADRRLVELVVAGEEDVPSSVVSATPAASGIECVRCTSSMRERPGLGHLADRQHVEVDLAQLVLVELRAGHRDGQLAAVDDRDAVLAELAQDPRQRPEVVLVAVRDDDRLDVVHPLAQVGEVGQHEVDAHHLRGREAQPAVDDHDAVVVLDDRQVLPDLAQAPEREDAQRAAHPA